MDISRLVPWSVLVGAAPQIHPYGEIRSRACNYELHGRENESRACNGSLRGRKDQLQARNVQLRGRKDDLRARKGQSRRCNVESRACNFELHD